MITQYYQDKRKYPKATNHMMDECCRIVNLCCGALGATREEILGDSKKLDLVIKRWIVWKMCVDKTGILPRDLAEIFCRGRGSIEYGLEALKEELEQSPRARLWMNLTLEACKSLVRLGPSCEGRAASPSLSRHRPRSQAAQS